MWKKPRKVSRLFWDKYHIKVYEAIIIASLAIELGLRQIDDIYQLINENLFYLSYYIWPELEGISRYRGGYCHIYKIYSIPSFPQEEWVDRGY